MTIAPEIYDVIGIGIGPSNLSLAALLDPEPGVTSIFLDRKPGFQWHTGLMVPGARMQVSFLKDLVTPVDPTNPHSFLNFLVERKRLYRMLVTGRDKLPRKEFAQYCEWAAGRLPSLRFGVDVSGVEWNGSSFVVHTGSGSLRAHNIVSGSGLKPKLPACAAGADSVTVLHAAQLLEQPRDFAAKRVAVVGGGQSGAEVVHYLLTREHRPGSILWGNSRPNLMPLDDSPFMDELFVPNYSAYFHSLADDHRAELLEQQRMASDGVSVWLLREIYALMYDLELLDNVPRPCRILTHSRLCAIEQDDDGLTTVWEGRRPPQSVHARVDYVICATGYEHGIPDSLGTLKDRMCMRNGQPVVRDDFSLEWDGPKTNRIFLQNAARHEFGVADPNLSLLAWRSATIANTLLGAERFDIGPVSAALDWATDSALPDDVAAQNING